MSRRSGRTKRKKIDAMQVTETLAEGLKHEFQISVPASDLDAKADAAGRPQGQGPPQRLPSRQGAGEPSQEGVWPLGDGETIDQTIRDTNTQIFTERGFRLATEPKITMPTEQKEVEDILTGKSDLTYTVAIEVVPPIQLADFKSFTVEKPVAEVTDADVDEAIKRIADQNRPYARKGRGRQGRNGDRVTISSRAPSTARRSRAAPAKHPGHVIGSNTFIPGFEEQLIGIGAAKPAP
jgi:trigger factor